jgi:hypothetical protein
MLWVLPGVPFFFSHIRQVCQSITVMPSSVNLGKVCVHAHFSPVVGQSRS